MIDYLAAFTPTELELLKSQNGKFTLNGSVLEFDDDLPEELLEKIGKLSRQFVVETWQNPATRREEHDVTVRKFLAVIGLTTEKTATSDGAERSLIVFDENTAQLLFTHKKYSGALLPRKNKYAYIIEQDRQIKMVFDEHGVARLETEDDHKAHDTYLKKKDINAKCADTDLLMTLAAAVKAAYLSNQEEKITVHLPSFAKALGVRFEKYGKDPEKNAHYDFWGKIKQLENIAGVLVEEDKILSAFKFYGYDGKANTLTFASPYLYALMDILQTNKIKSTKKKNNALLYEITGESYLVSSKINHARNKITAQIVQNIVVGLHQRGNKPDAALEPQKQHKDKRLITKTYTYKDLIKYTPLLKSALKDIEPKRRNQVLKRAVFGDDYNFNSKKHQTALIEEYLREFTAVNDYFVDFKITFEPATMKELENKITVTHHGINADFKEQFHIPHVKSDEDIFDES